MKGRIWTVPNQITFLRLCFLPFFLIFMSYEKYKWALLILVIAGFSDGIDGLIARRFNQHSSLGAYLDPIADKLLLSSSFVVLAFEKQLAWWLTILVLSRDLLLTTTDGYWLCCVAIALQVLGLLTIRKIVTVKL